MEVFAIDLSKASEFADQIRMIKQELSEAVFHLEDISKAIDSNEEDFMSRNDIGENLSLAAKAVEERVEVLNKIAKALDNTAAKAKRHEEQSLIYIES